MSNGIPQLKEESIPSLVDHDEQHHIQEIPTIEITPEAGLEDADLSNNEEEDNSELITPKKHKKKINKFGSALKRKMKVPGKGKAKKKLEDESVVDDMVIENSKVMSEEEESEEESGEDDADHTRPLTPDPEKLKDGESGEEIKETLTTALPAEDNVPEDKTHWKKKFSKLGGKFKSKGKSKRKQDEKTLIEEDGVPTDGKGKNEDKNEDDEDEDDDDYDDEYKNKESEGGRPSLHISSESQTRDDNEERKPDSKKETAREVRRRNREELLKKMESEGKLSTPPKSAEAAESPDPGQISEYISKPKRKRKKKRAPRELPSPTLNLTKDEAAATENTQPVEEEKMDEQFNKRETREDNVSQVPTREGKRKKKKKTVLLTNDNEVDGGVFSDKTDENVIIGEKQMIRPSASPPSPSTPEKSSTLKKIKPNKKSKGGPKTSEIGKDEEPVDVLSSPVVRKLDSVLGVKVHYAEPLYPTLHLLHPLVRVHVLDSTTGLPLPSTLGDERFTAIQPILTNPFDLRKNKTMSPCWEELHLVPESYDSILENSNSVVVFEIIDIAPAKALKKHKTGWIHIAWAFLKLRSGQGGYNVGRKLRLQLFKYPVIDQPLSDIIRTKVPLSDLRAKYPSTLYVTLQHVTDSKILSTLYSDHISNHNPALTRYIESVKSDPAILHQEETQKKAAPTWSRAPGQLCKIPTQLHEELPTTELGCLLMSFSNDGLRLACSCVGSNNIYPILVYSVPDCELMYTLQGHHNILYDLKWHKSALLSASSDCTARIWRNGAQAKIMSHPSFVYSAKWVDKRTIITGSYDKIIRLWDANCAGDKCALVAQLHGHAGHVNTIMFKGTDTFYSGDSKGEIIEWNGGGTAWSKVDTISLPEIKGMSISEMVLHPNKRKMFIQSRDNHVRLIDLRIRAITQRYTGHTNSKEHLRCSVSPCGSYLQAASEDGNVYVWLVETGDVTYTYTLDTPHSTSDVQFHPHDNYLVISGFGSSFPVLFYKQQRKDISSEVQGVDAAMKLASVKERLLTVSPNKTINTADIFTTKPLGTSHKLDPGFLQNSPNNMSITITPGKTHISCLPESSLKLRVLHDYTQQRSDEISLFAGDFIKLFYMDTDGWWVGENKIGSRGYFPSNYVEQPTPAQSITLRSLGSPQQPLLGTTPYSARRKIDFDMSLNVTKEWQTFDSTFAQSSPRSPSRMSEHDSIASSNLSLSRRRRTTAKVGAVQK